MPVTMQHFTRSLVAAAVVIMPAAAVKVTPVQKVVQLMEGMLAKGKEEKHKEQVQFAAPAPAQGSPSFGSFAPAPA